jgi:hypothetical protein
LLRRLVLHEDLHGHRVLRKVVRHGLGWLRRDLGLRHLLDGEHLLVGIVCLCAGAMHRRQDLLRRHVLHQDAAEHRVLREVLRDGLRWLRRDVDLRLDVRERVRLLVGIVRLLRGVVHRHAPLLLELVLHDHASGHRVLRHVRRLGLGRVRSDLELRLRLGPGLHRRWVLHAQLGRDDVLRQVRQRHQQLRSDRELWGLLRPDVREQRVLGSVSGRNLAMHEQLPRELQRQRAVEHALELR